MFVFINKQRHMSIQDLLGDLLNAFLNFSSHLTWKRLIAYTDVWLFTKKSRAWANYRVEQPRSQLLLNSLIKCNLLYIFVCICAYLKLIGLDRSNRSVFLIYHACALSLFVGSYSQSIESQKTSELFYAQRLLGNVFSKTQVFAYPR